MTSEQIKALMEARRATSKREAAMQIYMSAPSGFLGGISRSCRESLEKAIDDERLAKHNATQAGCDIGLVETGESMGITIDDLRAAGIDAPTASTTTTPP